jgi:hypothetical protein
MGRRIENDSSREAAKRAAPNSQARLFGTGRLLAYRLFHVIGRTSAHDPPSNRRTPLLRRLTADRVRKVAVCLVLSRIVQRLRIRVDGAFSALSAGYA